MPDTMEELGTGTLPQAKRGPGRPPTKPADIDEPLQWVTMEEAQRYERMLFKPYIRKKELNPGDNKKYFYQITLACPYSPTNVLTQDGQFLIRFEVNKFYRDKLIPKKIYDGKGVSGKEVQVEEQVERYSINEATGNGIDLDPDASFFMDSREFEQVFIRDTE